MNVLFVSGGRVEFAIGMWVTWIEGHGVVAQSLWLRLVREWVAVCSLSGAAE